jgi:hypothetical protein
VRSVGLSLFLKIYYAHKKKGKKEKTLQKIKEKQRQFIEIATRIKYKNKKFGVKKNDVAGTAEMVRHRKIKLRNLV